MFGNQDNNDICSNRNIELETVAEDEEGHYVSTSEAHSHDMVKSKKFDKDLPIKGNLANSPIIKNQIFFGHESQPVDEKSYKKLTEKVTENFLPVAELTHNSMCLMGFYCRPFPYYYMIFQILMFHQWDFD